MVDVKLDDATMDAIYESALAVAKPSRRVTVGDNSVADDMGMSRRDVRVRNLKANIAKFEAMKELPAAKARRLAENRYELQILETIGKRPAAKPN